MLAVIPIQKRVWSCLTSYSLRVLPFLAYDNANLAMVNSMMLRSSMHAFEKVCCDGPTIINKQTTGYDFPVE